MDNWGIVTYLVPHYLSRADSLPMDITPPHPDATKATTIILGIAVFLGMILFLAGVSAYAGPAAMDGPAIQPTPTDIGLYPMPMDSAAGFGGEQNICVTQQLDANFNVIEELITPC